MTRNLLVVAQRKRVRVAEGKDPQAIGRWHQRSCGRNVSIAHARGGHPRRLKLMMRTERDVPPAYRQFRQRRGEGPLSTITVCWRVCRLDPAPRKREAGDPTGKKSRCHTADPVGPSTNWRRGTYGFVEDACDLDGPSARTRPLPAFDRDDETPHAFVRNLPRSPRSVASSSVSSDTSDSAVAGAKVTAASTARLWCSPSSTCLNGAARAPSKATLPPPRRPRPRRRRALRQVWFARKSTAVEHTQACRRQESGALPFRQPTARTPRRSARAGGWNANSRPTLNAGMKLDAEGSGRSPLPLDQLAVAAVLGNAEAHHAATTGAESMTVTLRPMSSGVAPRNAEPRRPRPRVPGPHVAAGRSAGGENLVLAERSLAPNNVGDDACSSR